MSIKTRLLCMSYFMLLPCWCISRDLQNQFKYFDLVNKAELAICDSNYSTASKMYEKAFALPQSYSYSKDLQNYAVVSCLLNQLSKAKKCLSVLSARGCDSSWLYSLAGVESFKEKLKAAKEFKGKLIRDNIVKIDTVKKNYFDSLYKADQYYRGKPNAYVDFKDSIYERDRQLALELERYLGTNELPAEWETGNSKNNFVLPSYWALIRHNMYNGQQTVNFSNYLRQALTGKRIHPYIATALIENSIGNLNEFRNDIVSIYIYDSAKVYLTAKRTGDPQLSEFPGVEYCISFLAIDTNKVRAINSRRSEAGLEPLEDYKKKVAFSLKDRRFLFGFIGGIAEYFFSTRKDYLSVYN